MRTQRDFDVDAYLGLWYEIARKKFTFEKDCEYAEAIYELDNQNNVIKINNRCLDNNHNIIRESNGQARIINHEDKSKLKVKFLENDSGYSEGDYWVFYTDYKKYSIVGDPNRKYLWVLSRSSKIPKKDLPMLVEKIKLFGYDPDEVISNSKYLY